MEVDGQFRAPAGLIQEKRPPIPMKHENWWAPSLVCMLWEKEKSLLFNPGEKAPNSHGT